MCIRDRLNPEQQKAVCAVEPAVAVIAGPGTGKTKTLVSRAVHLLCEKQVSPRQLTAVTFTNKAAREMRERLTAELDKNRACLLYTSHNRQRHPHHCRLF